VPSEKILTGFKTLKPHFLIFGAKTSFGQIFKNIFKSKKIEIVWLKKPKKNQMAAVLIARILGKKFFWMQSFANPPVPDFDTKLLLTQPDRLLVADYKEAKKLQSFGVQKDKIKIQK
jgi:hypothetical protein